MTTVPARTIRVLIVDQSPTARERLRRVLEGAQGIEVVAEAGTADKAVSLIDETSPTIVLVDCELPKPGSFAAVQEILRLYPVPVVMLTKQGKEAASDLEAQALETGAVALTTWNPSGAVAGKDQAEGLIRTVRAMAEVKVVRRRAARPVAVPPLRVSEPISPSSAGASRIDIVAIGASTGGPPVLQTILRMMISRPLPAPIVLVQHLSPGFQGSLAAWLSSSTGVEVRVGEHGTPLTPGVVHLAPDNRHMTVDASGRVLLSDEPPENGSRPSVSVLFRSVNQHYGAHAIGVLLTGMGRDGAKELRLMRERGAVTIAQDEETSVVHGMPGEAIRLKGARYVLPPDRIAPIVERYVLGRATGHHEQGALPMAAC